MAETATINGTDLAYIEHGRGQPVVLVHGGVGDYRAWDRQMPAFGVQRDLLVRLELPVGSGAATAQGDGPEAGQATEAARR